MRSPSTYAWVGLAVMLASCTSTETGYVEPPPITVRADGSPPPPFVPPTPYQDFPTPLPQRGALGLRAVVARVVVQEAEQGRRVVAGPNWEAERVWVDALSQVACLGRCTCVAELGRPDTLCRPIDASPLPVALSAHGCGPAREYGFRVVYDPLRLVPLPSIEEIPPEEDL